jgi:MFS transporter, ACS family, D-galactonate transporter
MTPASRPTNVRWLILAMLVCFPLLAQFNRYNIAVVGAERFIGPDRMSELQVGYVYSAFLLVYSIGMLPGGWLIDRIGPKRALTVMGLGMGLCVILTGALGWLGIAIAALYLPLLLIRGLAGATCVPLHPGAARSVSLWFPLAGRSTANGLVTAGALVGIALSYPGFGWLMDRLDWPLGFVLCGALLMALALAWQTLAADDPADHRWTNAAERELAGGGDRTPPRSTATVRDVLALFRNRRLILLTLSYGAVGYVQYLFFYWMGYYFENELGLSKVASRKAAFTVTLAMAVGMASGGWMSDRLCRRFGHAAGCRVMAFTGMGLCAVFSLLGVSVTDPESIVWCFSLSLGSLGLCEGIFWTTAPALEKRSAGLACALLNTGGNFVGMLAPVFTPWIGRAFGWDAAIIVACVVCALGGALWLGITPHGSAGADNDRVAGPGS